MNKLPPGVIVKERKKGTVYQARLQGGCNYKHLGTFDNPIDAGIAYQRALEQKMSNNGRFAKQAGRPSDARDTILVYLQSLSEPVSTEHLALKFGMTGKQMAARLNYMKKCKFVSVRRENAKRDVPVWEASKINESVVKKELHSFNAYSTLEAMQQHTLLLLTGKANENVQG